MDFSSRLLTALALLTTIFMIVAQWFIWFYAPEELTMGIVQKIFYLHLPLAWWSFVAFFGVFVASILLLWRQEEKWDLWAGTLAEVGVLFCSLALISGSIWGRASWNTWWTWDPRLSTTLVMWFVYMGYLILRSANLGGVRGAKIRAVLGIVAFLDVPLVFLSARLWRSIHPAVFASQGGGLESEMWITVGVTTLAWGLLLMTLVVARMQNQTLVQRVEHLMVEWRDRTL